MTKEAKTLIEKFDRIKEIAEQEFERPGITKTDLLNAISEIKMLCNSQLTLKAIETIKYEL
jgi:hypothetical protein